MTQTLSVGDALARAWARLADRPDHAAAQALAILEAVPDHPQAQLLLGAAYRRLERLAESRAVLAPLAEAQPRAAMAQYEWGRTQAALGEVESAAVSLRRAVTLKADFADAWRALGDVLTLAGEAAQAEAAYAQHLRAGVHDPALMSAASALCDNDLPGVERLLRPHLREHPTDVAALRMLAEAGIRLGRYADAESLLARALALMPGFSAARHNLAVTLFRQDRATEAIPHLETLLAEEPRNPNFRNLLAACLATTGEFARAADTYAAVLQEFPRQPKIWLGYGHVLKTAGRSGEALSAYRTALAQAPSLGEAYWSIANLKTASFQPTELSTLRTRLAQTDLGVEDRFHMEYALGRALEQGAAYAESFAHYAEGARLRRGEIAYNADRTSMQLRRTRALMTQEFFESRDFGGCQDAAPIFIVGLPRSGSTLIEQIVSSHSQVEGTMELPDMALISRELGRGQDDTYPECLAELSVEARAALGQTYLDRTRVHRRTAKPFYIDKMPNNFVHVGLIHLILPNAKIIDARRGAMAACFSAFKQHFARGQHFSYDLTELGRYYADYVALMNHFDAALPGRVHRVRYESMVEQTEAEVRRLLGYLGLPFEPGCLDFHLNRRAVRTASAEQVRRPVYREGLDHWRHFDPFLAPLRAALGDLAGR